MTHHTASPIVKPSCTPSSVSRFLARSGFRRQRVWVLGIRQVYDYDAGFVVARADDGRVEVRWADSGPGIRERQVTQLRGMKTCLLRHGYPVEWVRANLNHAAVGSQPWARLLVGHTKAP